MRASPRWPGHLLPVLLLGLAPPLGAQSPSASIIPPDGGDSIYMAGARHPTLIMVDSSTTGSRELFAFQLALAPGDSLPLHQHHRDDELFFIHAGEVETRIADRKSVAVAGSTLFVPAGTPVGMVNKGPQLAKAWIVFASPHMAQYIRSLGSAPGEPPRKLSPAELENIRQRHHITFP